MKRSYIVLASLAFALSACTSNVQNANHETQNRMANSAHGTSMTMDDMTNALVGKTGDDFDRAFIEGMIPHHQGAIDMAKMALRNGKHDEIKKMAEEIISAQDKEISMMKQWAQDWGYTH